jgi:Methyltransferase FkbM domain
MQQRGASSDIKTSTKKNRVSPGRASSGGNLLVPSPSRGAGDPMMMMMDFEQQCMYQKEQKHGNNNNNRQGGGRRMGAYLLIAAGIVTLLLAYYFGYNLGRQQQQSSSPPPLSQSSYLHITPTTTTTSNSILLNDSNNKMNVAEFAAANAVEIFKTFMLNPPAPAKVPYNGVPAASMNSETHSNSQVGQDLTIDAILKRRRNGFFIEAGAYDGTSLSNSLFFELHRNWTGLLVEANPRAHRELLQKDRKAYNTPACISTSKNVELGIDFMASGMVGGYDNAARFDATRGSIGKNAQLDPYTYSVQAHCFPLNVMLDAIGVTHVDMFSLDVEGVELKILQAIDFDRVTIDLLVIEKNGMATEMEAFMKTKGYRTYTESSRGGAVAVTIFFCMKACSFEKIEG